MSTPTTAPLLSILIPVFNFDCSVLIAALARQGEKLKALGLANYEIILADDCSTDQATIKKNLAAIAACKGCRYLSQNEHQGRARNRNAAIRVAAGDWFIIIDCDALPPDELFLRRYLDARHQAPVVVGGLLTPHHAPRGCELRHRYERHADRSRTLAARQAEPHARFSTFNFMVRRQEMQQHAFDPRLTEYGYEDTLLGWQFQQSGIAIAHIANPLIHTGINNNRTFLENTERAMRNLYRLPMLHAHAGPSRMAQRLEKLHLKKAFFFFFCLTNRTIRRNLLSRHPSLLLFNIYKLGAYCHWEKALSETKVSQ